MYDTFLKLLTIDRFVQTVAESRTELLKELKDYGCDPVRRMRRIRMLAQLSQFEADMLKKIDSFESDDATEWLDSYPLMKTISDITNRSA